MKVKDLRKLIREAINEMEQDEIIPGISKNDEGEYNVSSSMALDLYDKYVRKSTTIGTLVDVLRSKLKAYKVELPDSEIIKIAYAIEDKGSRSSKSNRFKKRY